MASVLKNNIILFIKAIIIASIMSYFIINQEYNDEMANKFTIKYKNKLNLIYQAKFYQQEIRGNGHIFRIYELNHKFECKPFYKIPEYEIYYYLDVVRNLHIDTNRACIIKDFGYKESFIVMIAYEKHLTTFDMW